jgi:hypothetical protein
MLSEVQLGNFFRLKIRPLAAAWSTSGIVSACGGHEIKSRQKIVAHLRGYISAVHTYLLT